MKVMRLALFILLGFCFTATAEAQEPEELPVLPPDPFEDSIASIILRDTTLEHYGNVSRDAPNTLPDFLNTCAWWFDQRDAGPMVYGEKCTMFARVEDPPSPYAFIGVNRWRVFDNAYEDDRKLVLVMIQTFFTVKDVEANKIISEGSHYQIWFDPDIYRREDRVVFPDRYEGDSDRVWGIYMTVVNRLLHGKAEAPK